jgi:hypothetical protein
MMSHTVLNFSVLQTLVEILATLPCWPCAWVQWDLSHLPQPRASTSIRKQTRWIKACVYHLHHSGRQTMQPAQAQADPHWP